MGLCGPLQEILSVVLNLTEFVPCGGGLFHLVDLGQIGWVCMRYAICKSSSVQLMFVPCGLRVA